MMKQIGDVREWDLENGGTRETGTLALEGHRTDSQVAREN